MATAQALANPGKQAKSLGQIGHGNPVHEPAIALAYGRLPSSRFAALPGNEECQCNRIQSGDDKKTNTCQCERLRHGLLLTRLRQRRSYSADFIIGRGIEPEKAGTRCQSGQSRASARKV